MIEQPQLTDAQIDEIFNAMPGGIDGWLKSWGYRQFARAIEAKAALAERNACVALAERHFREYRDIAGEDLVRVIWNERGGVSSSQRGHDEPCF
ncbi:hypothetical protein [Comamonas sp.]|uniref:hypothetical protein n=1 Tax=Comamonas sp. TaxID=34028 RepID=UPI0028A7CD8F|nr:hypothetical protein [Comamonas sp.]